MFVMKTGLLLVLTTFIQCVTMETVDAHEIDKRTNDDTNFLSGDDGKEGSSPNRVRVKRSWNDEYYLGFLPNQFKRSWNTPPFLKYLYSKNTWGKRTADMDDIESLKDNYKKRMFADEIPIYYNFGPKSFGYRSKRVAVDESEDELLEDSKRSWGSAPIPWYTYLRRRPYNGFGKRTGDSLLREIFKSGPYYRHRTLESLKREHPNAYSDTQDRMYFPPGVYPYHQIRKRSTPDLADNKEH